MTGRQDAPTLPRLWAEDPCTTCQHVNRCATGEACAAFREFLEKGYWNHRDLPRYPRRDIYRALFRPSDGGGW